MDVEHELVGFGETPKTDFAQVDVPLNEEQKDSWPIGLDSQHDRDAHTLARLGKRQVLKVRSSTELPLTLILALIIVRQRRFGFMSMLSFSCTVLITWEGVLVLVFYIARGLLLLLTLYSGCLQKASQSRVAEPALTGKLLLTIASGGPAGLVYGFIIAWIGTCSIFVTISELASLCVNCRQVRLYEVCS